jgi:hypothetical protein
MHKTYITVFTPEMRPMLIPPLATHCLLFLLITPFYLLGEPAFMLVVRIPIHSCPRFAINCSPLATSPTPTHPHKSGYKIYIDDINNISRPL